MKTINTEEKRNYFREFKCEVLTSNPDNKELIKDFVSKKAKNQLESYIKDEDKAWAEDIDGETRVYLIKDKSGRAALFFSIKCGLLIRENSKYKLTQDERQFVDFILEFFAEQMNALPVIVRRVIDFPSIDWGEVSVFSDFPSDKSLCIFSLFYVFAAAFVSYHSSFVFEIRRSSSTVCYTRERIHLPPFVLRCQCAHSLYILAGKCFQA